MKIIANKKLANLKMKIRTKKQKWMTQWENKWWYNVLETNFIIAININGPHKAKENILLEWFKIYTYLILVIRSKLWTFLKIIFVW